MSFSPRINSDPRALAPPTDDTGNHQHARLNRHQHLPLEPLDFHLPTSSIRPSPLQPAETENSFFLQHPPQYPLPTFDDIVPHTLPPTESPAMPEVVLADDLDAESQDDNSYSELLAAVDRIHRTRHDPSMLSERRVLKVPRVRKHYSSSARRERKIRSRSHSSDINLLDVTEETYSRGQYLSGHLPMQEERLQEEPGSSWRDNASGPPVSLPEARVGCTGESRPATPPKIGVDMGQVDWCQQTPPYQTCLEECPMDWTGNSPPAATPPPPPSQQRSIY